MLWCFGKVVEDENQVKLLETKLHTLQRGDFDFRESDDQEGRIEEVNEAVGCGL